MKSHLSEDIIPVTDLVHGASRFIKRLRLNRRPVLVTQHGRGALVCIDVKAYQDYINKTEMIDAILLGEQAFARGKFSSWSHFRKQLKEM